MTLSAGDRLVPNVSQVAGEVIEGEAIIIDLASGVYYSMTGTGGALWALLEEGRTLGEAAAAIAARYAVPVGRVQADVERVAAELLAHGLVVRGGAAPAAGPAAAPPGPEPGLAYATPELQVYRDLSALLALDPPAPGLKDIPWKASTADPG
jgi:hypothetical protein